ncbi:hypothetical protein D9757_006205 [Collybiopsis confluens]|uniref:3'-5' exonuclease n=1 Tax=Collybiopsis confluens TaxID=2823264 RepID=A0A8H5HJV5_9AGAR|nr:hypothetical protein D9757_006205 [Collybiopsis confluens]
MLRNSPNPTSSMKPHYLKDKSYASIVLRHLADILNETAYQACLANSSPPHIGFDLEWKPNYRPGELENPIAVIQIAYETASYVIHVRWMTSLPDGLAEILENPRIVKVGVGIQNDAKKLYRDLKLSLTSCVDLSLFVKCVDFGLFAERLVIYAGVPLPSPSKPDPPPLPADVVHPWDHYNSEAFLGPHYHRLFRGHYNGSIGLARLAEIFAGVTLAKGRITRSNWDVELTPQQLTYAALDAYAGFVIYDRLLQLFDLLESSTRPRRRFYAFDCIRGTLYHCCGDNERTVLGQQVQVIPTLTTVGLYAVPAFLPVEEEIFLHLQGIGTDQPRGLDPWTSSNPEYDSGPLPPKKTEEEKEKLRMERQKRKEDEKGLEETEEPDIERQQHKANANAETAGLEKRSGNTTVSRPGVARGHRHGQTSSIGSAFTSHRPSTTTTFVRRLSKPTTASSQPSNVDGVAVPVREMKPGPAATTLPNRRDRIPPPSRSTKKDTSLDLDQHTHKGRRTRRT